MTQDDDDSLSMRAGSDRSWTYGHIVVDEAQELTAMDWRMLVRRCPSRSFTIVGDVAQTSALGGTHSWDSTMNAVFGPQGWDQRELTINYRNPQEVSDLASRFASRSGLYVSTVKAVREMPDSVSRLMANGHDELVHVVSDTVLDLASRYVASDGTGRVAVIAPDSWKDDLRGAIDAALRSHLSTQEYDRLTHQPSWDEQVSLCSVGSVKGLEYDAVVVVEPGEIEQSAPSRLTAAADLYVAMTRPTQRLVIARTRDDAKSSEI